MQGIALYTNLYGNDPHVSDADTSIVWQDGQPLTIVDPHGFFKSVTDTATDQNGKKAVDFDITYAKPMPTSDMIIRMWDKSNYLSDTTVINATVLNRQNLYHTI